jgi:hypothetical protein
MIVESFMPDSPWWMISDRGLMKVLTTLLTAPV